jgi:hypothetical protein
MTHDPREQIKIIQQILASDTKRIGFLFGAGTSYEHKPSHPMSKVPCITELTTEVLGSIKEKDQVLAIDKIKAELQLSNVDSNIENIMSKLIQKIEAVGADTLCGLTKTQLERMKTKMENKIVEKVSVHRQVDEFRGNLLHDQITRWIKQISRKYPIEIFTSNYDMLLEISFEHLEVPYFDGFVGSFSPFFLAQSVEDTGFAPRSSKLWKIHGSLGWNEKTDGKVCKGNVDTDKLLIYPSLLKYSQSQKTPYFSFLNRLKNFLVEEDGVLITCGYSFGDQHINDFIVSGISGSRSSQVFALYYADFKDDDQLIHLSNSHSQITTLGRKEGIIGCRRGDWKINIEPPKDELIAVKKYYCLTSPGNWDGKGEFLLPKFSVFSDFLSSYNLSS